KDIFLTTKLWPQDFDDPRGAFETSLDKLGLDYMDLYLIHWPSGTGRRRAWEELSRIYEEGKSKSVGVSNYMVDDLEELFKESELVPSVNQIEFHPFIYKKQKPVLELCKDKG